MSSLGVNSGTSSSDSVDWCYDYAAVECVYGYAEMYSAAVYVGVIACEASCVESAVLG